MLICNFITIFSIYYYYLMLLTGVSAKYVYSIDSSSEVSNIQGWGTSSYLADYKFGFEMQMDYTKGYTTAQNFQPIRALEDIVFNLADEAFGLQIPYIEAYKENKQLTKREDFLIFSSIFHNVFPLDYFDSSAYNKGVEDKESISKSSLYCNYLNPGPGYARTMLQDVVNVDSVVNLFNWNLGLKKGEKGIKVLLFENFVLTYKPFDSFIAEHNEIDKFAPTDDILFKKLLLTQNVKDYMSRSYVLSALTEDNLLRIYNVTDNLTADILFRQYRSIQFQEEINKFLVDGDLFIMSSSNKGFYVCSANPDVLGDEKFICKKFEEYNTDSNEVIDLKIKDMAVFDFTLYIIVEAKGLFMFDLKTLKFYDNYFAHPLLHQIDNTFYHQMSYIGVVVNNNPPSVPEFFIEFAHNYKDSGSPLVNKVFISNHNIPIEDIATDNSLGMTYILDTNTNSLLALTRSVPNSLQNYNYKIPLNHTFDLNKGVELFLLAGSDVYFPSVVIKNGGDYLSVGNFEFPRNKLICNFNFEGNYTINFNAPGDCSYLDKELDTFKYIGCYYNTTFTFPVRSPTFFNSTVKPNLTALFVILPILVVIIISVVVYFCVKSGKCCKKSISNAGGNSGNNDVKYFQQFNKEMEPVSNQSGRSNDVSNIDNKL